MRVYNREHWPTSGSFIRPLKKVLIEWKSEIWVDSYMGLRVSVEKKERGSSPEVGRGIVHAN